jgi:hypothetical protein
MECGRRLGRSSRRGRGRGYTNITDVVARKLVLVLLLMVSYFDPIRRWPCRAMPSSNRIALQSQVESGKSARRLAVPRENPNKKIVKKDNRK